MLAACFAILMSSFVIRGRGLRVASPTPCADHPVACDIR